MPLLPVAKWFSAACEATKGTSSAGSDRFSDRDLGGSPTRTSGRNVSPRRSERSLEDPGVKIAGMKNRMPRCPLFVEIDLYLRWSRRRVTLLKACPVQERAARAA